MARTMAGLTEQYRAVVSYTYLGPDVYSNYTPGHINKHHGAKYEAIYGPYSKASTAKGVATEATGHITRDINNAIKNNDAPPYALEVKIQRATIKWEDVE